MAAPMLQSRTSSELSTDNGVGDAVVALVRQASSLSRSTQHSTTTLCMICFENMPIDDMLNLAACHSTEHHCCISCAAQYFTSRIKEGRVSDLQCPVGLAMGFCASTSEWQDSLEKDNGFIAMATTLEVEAVLKKTSATADRIDANQHSSAGPADSSSAHIIEQYRLFRAKQEDNSLVECPGCGKLCSPVKRELTKDTGTNERASEMNIVQAALGSSNADLREDDIEMGSAEVDRNRDLTKISQAPPPPPPPRKDATVNAAGLVSPTSNAVGGSSASPSAGQATRISSIRLAATDTNLVTCDKCEAVFCRHHSWAHREDLSPTACADYERRILAEERAHASAFGVKSCAGCGQPTIKNGGCNHMTCKACHCDWCWICGGKIKDGKVGWHYSEENPDSGCMHFAAADEHPDVEATREQRARRIETLKSIRGTLECITMPVRSLIVVTLGIYCLFIVTLGYIGALVIGLGIKFVSIVGAGTLTACLSVKTWYKARCASVLLSSQIKQRDAVSRVATVAIWRRWCDKWLQSATAAFLAAVICIVTPPFCIVLAAFTIAWNSFVFIFIILPAKIVGMMHRTGALEEYTESRTNLAVKWLWATVPRTLGTVLEDLGDMAAQQQRVQERGANTSNTNSDGDSTDMAEAKFDEDEGGHDQNKPTSNTTGS